MTKAFVSYSRKDTEFTRKLTDALIAQQYELWIPADVGSILPFCSETTGGSASCPLLAHEQRSQFCVDNISYSLYAVPQGSTLTPINPDYKCNDEGVFSGDQLFSCYGPPTNGFQASVCNSGCITSQSDQCTDGYGLDPTGSCCMPMQSAGTNGCIEVTLTIVSCSVLE